VLRRVAGSLLLLALALAGCAGTHPSGGPGSSPSGIPGDGLSGTPSSSPTGTPNSSPSSDRGTLGELTRDGGFAGLSDRLVVQQDGSFTLVRLKPAVNRSGQLTAAELASLRQLLADSGIAGLPTVPATAKGNDLFTYRVTYRNSRIVAQDGAVAVPLRPVISALTGIVTKYGA